MTTTTRVLLLIAIGIGLLAGAGLFTAKRHSKDHLAVYMWGMLLLSMVAFAVWPVLHYIGLRTDSGLATVPSLPFLLASGAALAASVAFGIARLVVALSGRRRRSATGLK